MSAAIGRAGTSPVGTIERSPQSNKPAQKPLGILCLVVLSIILTAGLWPFGAPPNRVTWLSRTNGLHFAYPATVLATSSLPPGQLSSTSSCTLEIWLQPASILGESTFLSFYGPSRLSRFSLHQSDSDLLLKTQAAASSRADRQYVDYFFQKRQPVLLTISSGAGGTNIYKNGFLLLQLDRFRVSPQILRDRFVLGTSLTQADTWSGDLHGLALYATELTPSRVLDHYRSWAHLGQPPMPPSIAAQDGAAAIYPFSEHAGVFAHSLIGTGVPLEIPSRFQLVKQDRLSLPWQGFHSDWSYWQDIAINVLGFVPLGFVFCAYWACSHALRPAVITAVLAGVCVTFAIEILQSHLPTRSSDLTDVLTNILGASLGALLYAWKPLRALLGAILADIESV